MPALHTAPAATDGAGTPANPSRTPIVITEHEVALSTAAAAALPSTATTRRWGDGPRFVATLRRMLLTATSSPPPARRHYPARYSYLERAVMGREMDRL
jgi:hypothetical protein